jgi:voltage-gated potassium channel
MAPWRERLHEIIFEADTPAGKAFDIALLLAILLSVSVVMLESVESINDRYADQLLRAEWFFTILFTIEYVLRLICVRRKSGYVFSFYGIIDLLAILPSWLSLLVPGVGQTGIVIRSLRLLRVFRVFNVGRVVHEAQGLKDAVKAARGRIVIFLSLVLTVVVILGAAMYLVEGAENGFTSIPTSMYWAIVTMTTVGYGDIAPHTVLGKLIAAVVMVLGYSLIIVPTGIISAEVVVARVKPASTQSCPECTREGHDADAKHCKFCGAGL